MAPCPSWFGDCNSFATKPTIPYPLRPLDLHFLCCSNTCKLKTCCESEEISKRGWHSQHPWENQLKTAKIWLPSTWWQESGPRSFGDLDCLDRPGPQKCPLSMHGKCMENANLQIVMKGLLAGLMMIGCFGISCDGASSAINACNCQTGFAILMANIWWSLPP